MLAQAERHLKWTFEFLGEGCDSQSGAWNFIGDSIPEFLMELNGMIICYANFRLPRSFLGSIIMCWGETALRELPFQQLIDLRWGWNQGRCWWPDGQGVSLRPALVVRRQAQDFYRTRKMALSPSFPLTSTSTCQAYTSDCVNDLTNVPTLPGSPPAWVLRSEACWSSSSLGHARESAEDWRWDRCAATTTRTALQ